VNKVDLLFPAYNRLGFTQVAWENLVEHTDWSLVNKLSVYSVASTDGTLPFLKNAVETFRGGCRIEFVVKPLTPIVQLQTEYIAQTTAPYVGKIDNDTMVSPRWLNISLGLLERRPELSFLGLEVFNEVKDVPDEEYGYSQAGFISGLFIARREALLGSRPIAYGQYYGWEDWQEHVVPALVKGWIKPSLPFFLLDRLPIEPWRAMSKEYERLGWQRFCHLYLPECTLWEWKWPGGRSGMAFLTKPDINCTECHGGGRVRFKTKAAVFATVACPKCLGLKKVGTS
jgi:hypothetical protein